jgi:hypothetical protein
LKSSIRGIGMSGMNHIGMMMDQGNETVKPNYDHGTYNSFSKRPSIHTGIGGIMAHQEDLARTK